MQPQRAPRPTLYLLLGLAACGADPELLNSEHIARIYSNYGIEVIENKNNIRISNLYSQGADGAVCRTFAVVEFSDPIAPEFSAEHALILSGGSIGAVLRDRGWGIRKEHRYTGEIAIGPDATRITRLMRLEPPATLGIHVYRLRIAKNGRSFGYATIAEVHHPDYLPPSGLYTRYGRGYLAGQPGDEVGRMLERVLAGARDVSGAGPP